MSDPFFRATTPDGRMVLEVRVPESADDESKDVLFTCTVTLDGKIVLDDLETEDQPKMLAWARKHMKEMARRSS